MRAEGDRARRARSAESRRRAGGYLLQLQWLRGFPAGEGSWQPLGAIGPIALDGTLIARSRRVARTLLREHRDALAGLIGDIDRWWQIVDATLAWCSKPVGTLDLIAFAPPRVARRARELAVRAPELVAAAGVAWAHEPQQLAAAIEWIGQHPELGELELALAIGLVRLAVIDRAGGEAALALARVDAPEGKQALERVRHIDHCVIRIQPVKPVNVKRSTTVTVPWLRKLAASEAPAHALGLLAAADIASALEPWVSWERAHAPRLDRAIAFANAGFHDSLEHRQPISDGLDEVIAQAPTHVDFDTLLDLDLVAGDARYRAAATRFVAAVPRALGPAARARMLAHVGRIVARAEDDDRPVWVWTAMADELARGAPVELFGPWSAALERAAFGGIEDDVMDAKPTRAQVRAVVASLARLAARGPVVAADADRAVAWVMAGLVDVTLDDAIARMRATERSFTPNLARAAVALVGTGDVEQLCALAIPLVDALDNRRWRLRDEVQALVDHAVRDGAGWVIRDALARGRAEEVVSAASIASLMTKSRWPAFRVPVAATGWIARYPDALAPALRRLAEVDPDAEATAARRLATDLPDPAALRREVANLRGRETLGERLAIRLANLEQRLRAPRLPSAKRLAHLAERLEQTAATLGLARFTAGATAAATARLVRAFELGRWPGWPIEERDREILFELLRLDEPVRTLAGRLLRARAGPPPWDLRDDPANRAFLDALRAHGMDPAPWLDTTPRSYRGFDGKPVELALCGDPLEVFAMGAHFETCLSPDRGNFFSTVVNAAEINKRVLYARRAGRVVGRCLFAITTTHALLTFHVYSHLAGVEELVRVFAIDLAERMHTTIVPRGAVETLLANEWYDDGPRDLVGRFAALDRLDFVQLEPATLVPALRDALGHDLDDITLPIVIAHEGMQRRPPLIAALAPHLLASHRTPPSTLRDAACLAMRAGDLALADRLLGNHAAGIGLEYALYTHAVLLARLRPSLALAKLRATRDRTVRRAEDDSPDRNALAAIALLSLHRPKQAATMLAHAVKRRPEIRSDIGYYGIDLSGLGV